MDKRVRILLVEDDAQIREVITDYFLAKGAGRILLDCAEDGIEGGILAKRQDYDLVLLDIMLPGMDGFSLCRSIRQHSIVPIIFLTARGQEEDRLYGYSLGCDDYVVKPFSIAELFAKTQALLNRSKGMLRPAVLRAGSIELNPVTFQVMVEADGESRAVELAPKEYALLRYFMENKGIVLSRDMLLNRVWGYDYMGNDRIVDNHVKKLRKALGTAGTQIKTVVTQGYRLEG
ncbi:MAG: response regulator transcription factor [Bacteroides sp.]|nr:response regulator transcription factor [Bacteroides sp.]MCM1548958.1 response regulator transcription factor [Clostridium sp.]